MQSNLKSTGSEEWRAVVGFEEVYEVSNLSRVRSLDRRVRSTAKAGTTFRPGKILKPLLNKGTGKYHLDLQRDGLRKNKMLHRVVAEAFIPNPEGLPLVRHLNDDPSDNRLENLSWGTYADNMNDRIRNGIHHQVNKTHCPKGHPYSAENTYSPEGRNQRNCRKCQTERKRRYNERNRKR